MSSVAGVCDVNVIATLEVFAIPIVVAVVLIPNASASGPVRYQPLFPYLRTPFSKVILGSISRIS